jgi:dihydroorotate dehydrogenase
MNLNETSQQPRPAASSSGCAEYAGLGRWLYRALLRPALFAQDAERIHQRTLRMLGFCSRHEWLCHTVAALFAAPALPTEQFGLQFPNPIGLAAGMDKQAEALPAWAALGFGWTELGAVTWHPQPGNPPPRLFRAIRDQAIVNRMGFNNPGAQEVAQILQQWRRSGRWPNHPVGMNLGKSKITPLQKAAEDYARSFRLLLPYLDFFVVNVSSPNTPNLRQLQDKTALDDILCALDEVQPTPAGSPPSNRKPVLVKVAPDLSFDALDQILELAGPRHLAGIIATNTTLARPDTTDPKLRRIYEQAGGLSGRPLRARSTEVIRHLYRQTGGKLPIVGVGGIFSAADAWEKLTAGASLVQLYTSLVYEGPGVVGAILRGLLHKMRAAGLGELREAVGLEFRQS